MINQEAIKLEDGKSVTDDRPPPLTARRSKRVSLLMIISQVFEKLAPFLVCTDKQVITDTEIKMRHFLFLP